MDRAVRNEPTRLSRAQARQDIIRNTEELGRELPGGSRRRQPMDDVRPTSEIFEFPEPTSI
jgi:hypothetical protein